jgi:hypothetical protein
MIAMLSMGFEYKEKAYSALIRVKRVNGSIEYHLTIMNGDLERLLYGCHIFKKENDRLIPCQPAKSQEVELLQSAVCGALQGLPLHEFSSFEATAST